MAFFIKMGRLSTDPKNLFCVGNIFLIEAVVVPDDKKIL